MEAKQEDLDVTATDGRLTRILYMLSFYFIWFFFMLNASKSVTKPSTLHSTNMSNIKAILTWISKLLASLVMLLFYSKGTNLFKMYRESPASQLKNPNHANAIGTSPIVDSVWAFV